MRISQAEAEESARKQAGELGKTVGAGEAVPADLIQIIHEAAQALRPVPKYTEYSEIRFVWEMLDMKSHTAIVRQTVDNWIKDENNIRRASKQVNRNPRTEHGIVSGFGIFRMKARPGPDWALLDDHGRPEQTEPDRHKPQTVVFIALSRLDRTNGFFMELEAGQDVCIDSNARIVYPSTGGGLGIAIWLRL